MRKLGILLMIAFFLILIPAAVMARQFDSKVGSAIIELQSGDRLWKIWNAMSEKNELPRHKNLNLWPNWLKATCSQDKGVSCEMAEAEEWALTLKAGQRLMVPFMPLEEYQARIEKSHKEENEKLTASLKEAADKLSAAENAGLKAEKAKEAAEKITDLTIAISFPVFGILLGVVITQTLLLLRERRKEKESWVPGGERIYEVNHPKGKIKVAFRIVGSGEKNINGVVVPFLKLKSPAKIADPIIHSEPKEKVTEHILKYFTPEGKVIELTEVIGKTG